MALLILGIAIYRTHQIHLAKDEITSQYLAESSTNCNDPTDPIKPAERAAVFRKYLKVNSDANRAVMRGCNDTDTLLVKTSDGQWRKTPVNISLDRRANPRWQKECNIQDITTTDDRDRPENSTIDEINFKICKYINQHDSVPTLQEITQGLEG